jgi:hypothetical protein
MKNKNIFAAIAAIAIAAGRYGAYRFGVHQGMQSAPETVLLRRSPATPAEATLLA